MIDQVIHGEKVHRKKFNEYDISVTNLKLNTMYNSKLDDFLFLRK